MKEIYSRRKHVVSSPHTSGVVNSNPTPGFVCVLTRFSLCDLKISDYDKQHLCVCICALGWTDIPVSVSLTCAAVEPGLLWTCTGEVAEHLMDESVLST